MEWWDSGKVLFRRYVLRTATFFSFFSFCFDCGLTFYQIGIIGEGRGWTDGWMDGNKVDGL